jgi:hypothetical protein
LLDISTEGKLLRQVKDISNEILIMVEIEKKQKTVLEQFKKHAETISSYKPHSAEHAKHTALIRDAESEDTEVSKKNKPIEMITHKDGDWGTLDFATEVLKSLEERIADLGNLRVSAEYAEKAASYKSYFSQIVILTGVVGRSSVVETAAGRGCTSPKGCSTDRGNPATRDCYHVVHSRHHHLCEWQLKLSAV